ncbi:cobyrinate a,c-diamide synthase [Tellurirhabdus bombi]|uniref:cobyrinate a,c-diamide synthase n=1 Tax=Tellurirhabdus bombi TaxID=2907205 RepID=UPI001F31ACEC|nr:cobyrinate a,c-diamide synthase [Tellurirhabdus bombi]
MADIAQFLLAAPSSGSGKTTMTLGLLRTLANRGLRVQPFKCGPDYIDTLHHTRAAQQQSINLDLFMSSEQHVLDLYARYAGQANVAVTEGVMGLFDGSEKMQGSSAALAELLNIPVILVINAKAMAYSVAPLLYGFKNFRPGVRVVGAIFNFVNTPSHYRFLEEACQEVGVEALGYLPANPAFAIPSRHLGLHISAETDYERIIQTVADEIPKTINLDRLLELTQGSLSPSTTLPKQFQPKNRIRLAVARDEAFTFMYAQNIDQLKSFGDVSFFSPLRDKTLPETDFLYLPGGYPELYAKTLSQNETMRESIRAYAQNGGLTYVECGGLMYLGRFLTDAAGQSFPMVGALDVDTTMQNSKLTLGYRILTWDNLRLKGHEFHYSRLDEVVPQSSVAVATNAKGVEVPVKLYRKHNTFGSYTHLYWGGQPEFIEHLLRIGRF